MSPYCRLNPHFPLLSISTGAAALAVDGRESYRTDTVNDSGICTFVLTNAKLTCPAHGTLVKWTLSLAETPKKFHH